MSNSRLIRTRVKSSKLIRARVKSSKLIRARVKSSRLIWARVMLGLSAIVTVQSAIVGIKLPNNERAV